MTAVTVRVPLTDVPNEQIIVTVEHQNPNQDATMHVDTLGAGEERHFNVTTEHTLVISERREIVEPPAEEPAEGEPAESLEAEDIEAAEDA